jgi:hypothetical protein
MKKPQKGKRASSRQPQKVSAAEAWRNAQSDALAAYMVDKQANSGLPALSQMEINEIYGQPLLNPLLRRT